MMRYSVQPRDRIFVKGYGFLSFAENTGKNVSKNLHDKYSQKLLDNAKQSAIDALNSTSKKVIQKTCLKSNPQTVTNEHDKEMPKERYVSPEERQKIIDNLTI